MAGISSRKFCVICGVEEEEEGSDKEGEGGIYGPLFSKEIKLAKFCGELELCSSSLTLNGIKEFTAFNFLQQLDKCSDWVKICGGCTTLIGETVDKRVELEEVECQVLELQIKLLIKLKEMEEINKLYLREMGEIKERVKGAQLNGLVDGGNIFGKGQGKCDLLGFRERILNVVTSLGIFQDNLEAKQNPDLEGENIQELKIMEDNCSKLTPTPSAVEDQDNYYDFADNLSLNSQPSSPPDLNDDDDDLQDKYNDKVDETLEGIKMETDKLEATFEDKPKDDKPKKVKPRRKAAVPRRKQSKINREKLSKVNWSEMGPLKSRLIRGILTRCGYHQDNPFNQYKWTYDVSSDNVEFAGYPIEIIESHDDEDGYRIMTFKCAAPPSCGDTDNYKISFKFPANLEEELSVKKIGKGLDFLKRKTFDHVLSIHLNAFQCSQCAPEEDGGKIQFKSLRKFQAHLNLNHSGGGKIGETKVLASSSNFCEICGQTFKSDRGLKLHLTRHLINDNPGEADNLKKFQCATCGRKFFQSTTLKEHEDLHKPKEERVKIKCSFCGKEVLKRCYLIHKKYSCSQQSKCLKMECEICGKFYKNEKSLGDHLVRTHKLKERPKFKK